ncbi:unnamed protein product [Periconia digitata]|uniref:Oxidase ustYa n=1 Tax=Periconia digitata TaxID=1303443 RepID=A0A9W4UBV2_9PLEO|nr:unnamed protein product [Periconia digitata]
MKLSLPDRTKEYLPLSQKTEDSGSRPGLLTLRNVVLSLVYIALLVVAFFVGQKTALPLQRPPIAPDLPIPVGTATRMFNFNRTFSQAPSNATDEAWKSIFPRDGVFFKLPPTIPDRSTISVFHQLHCLDSIRHSYWRYHAAAVEGKKLDENDTPFLEAGDHVRHCIDLIRQGLMCTMDLTVEKDKKAGVRGFGTEHQCRNWDDLIQAIDNS